MSQYIKNDWPLGDIVFIWQCDWSWWHHWPYLVKFLLSDSAMIQLDSNKHFWHWLESFLFKFSIFMKMTNRLSISSSDTHMCLPSEGRRSWTYHEHSTVLNFQARVIHPHKHTLIYHPLLWQVSNSLRLWCPGSDTHQVCGCHPIVLLITKAACESIRVDRKNRWWAANRLNTKPKGRKSGTSMYKMNNRGHVNSPVYLKCDSENMVLNAC